MNSADSGSVFRPVPSIRLTRDQTEKLYGKAMELAELTGKETVLDAYCGIGTIGLYRHANTRQSGSSG